MNKHMMLKVSLRKFGTLALLIITVLLAGCSFTGETIQDRIETFIDAINAGDVQKIKDCLDPAATNYNTASTMDFWSSYFPQIGKPYSISSYQQSGNTATVIFSEKNNYSYTYVFEMTEHKGSGLFSGTTYLIRRIRTSSSQDYFFE